MTLRGLCLAWVLAEGRERVKRPMLSEVERAFIEVVLQLFRGLRALKLQDLPCTGLQR